jgi:hypothetical protein
MANIINTSVLDALLDELAAADELFVCSDEPTTYAEAASTYNLATIALTGGDFSKSAHDTTGRKLTRAAQNGEDVDVSGDAVYIAYGINSGSVLLRRVACATETLDSAGQVNVGADEVQLAQPA